MTTQEVEQIMKACDQDGNGAISYNEFISATLASRIYKDKKLMEKAFGFFDRDGDGAITVDELKQVFLGD